jgi:hypothetical protein
MTACVGVGDETESCPTQRLAMAPRRNERMLIYLDGNDADALRTSYGFTLTASQAWTAAQHAL